MRKKRARKAKYRVLLFFVLAVAAFGAFFSSYVGNPENFRSEKNLLRAALFTKFQESSYNAESLILADLSDGSVFVSKKEKEPRIPASLAKLFVVEYAASLADLDSVVPARWEAIALTKPGSSVAGIQPGDYFLRDLFAAMLIPSGNDAAYVVADYCGGILSPQTPAGQGRVDVFMECLNEHLREQGYEDTILYDPSGFDTDARTTVCDLKAVVSCLLEKPWFRQTVSQRVYTAELPNGEARTWKNTNQFLDPGSEYYNENVKGVKTGSLFDDYNLVVLYEKHGKEFLICSLGSQSDSARYDDVNYLLKTIDESDYLAGQASALARLFPK